MFHSVPIDDAYTSFYDHFNDRRVGTKLLGEVPDEPGNNLHIADFIYTTEEQPRLWQAWVALPQIAEPGPLEQFLLTMRHGAGEAEDSHQIDLAA
ncbi:hypothetical protein N5D52_13720 [Pseudomonas sp. GD03860]|uniref:hypothetical protein n=1 Tax=Pseudomonas TaxID=286 RepID=UPI002363BFDD|nr:MULTISPECIES: hypothetical protein [Pseudomonas]MDD2056796.1 hypothetical protein [Pseudomonas putida]MDH0638005.1 hypothetical protein [Pseudomonas sp. GD03860]